MAKLGWHKRLSHTSMADNHLIDSSGLQCSPRGNIYHIAASRPKVVMIRHD